jgi:hypothetical protein
MATRQLADAKYVTKRYADTGVLLAEFYTDVPFSERSAAAIGRLNYLHGHYIKAGKITNDDMLYTLSLFMTQPREWVERYEWRKFTELEVSRAQCCLLQSASTFKPKFEL